MASSHQTPPFFKRGLPPGARATIYLALCFTLLVADLRLHYLDTLRQGLTVLTYPLRYAATTPADFVRNADNYFGGLATLQAENKRLKAQQLEMASQSMFAQELARENDTLRGLLGVTRRVGLRSTAAQIVFPSRDPFSRRVILDKGSRQGIEPGSAVVDSRGLLGQVTRVFPLHAEVTLVSDKEQAIPVVIGRSGLRAVMFGTGSGLLELKFLAANAEVRPGDRILTSGLDGIYAPGIPVAVVLQVTRDSAGSFARILCKPIAAVERNGAVLVLSRTEPASERPVDEASDAHRSSSGRIRQRNVADAFVTDSAMSAPVASAPVASASAASASAVSAPAASAPAVSAPAASAPAEARAPVEGRKKP